MNDLFWKYVDCIYTANDNKILIFGCNDGYYCYHVGDAFGEHRSDIRFKEIKDIKKLKGLIIGVEYNYNPNSIILKTESNNYIPIEFTYPDSKMVFGRLCYFMLNAVADHNYIITNTTQSLDKIETIWINATRTL